MRLPRLSDLSREQRQIYSDAPLDGTVLITGPPGTGKTVMALWRGMAVDNDGGDVAITMFNRVLRSFTRSENNSCEVHTMYSWVWTWWLRAFYRPRLRFDRGRPDWIWALERIIDKHQRGILRPARIAWGHLIVDEGQDFPPDMYRLFRMLQVHVDDPESSAMTILADQNQRLSESNSTIGEIRTAACVADNRHYPLTKNFRNTLQIARLAGEFFCGHATGRPELPSHEGDTPRLVRCEDMDEEVAYIARYARQHDNEEIGVIIMNGPIREPLVAKLESALADTSIDVQTYTYVDREAADDLVFDEPGVVSVLHKESSKGLEFDAVFLPHLQILNAAEADSEQTRMNFYVMMSRARKRLFLSYSGEAGQFPEALQILPDESTGLLIREGV